MLALVTFPLCIGLSLVAYPIVKIGFGTEWVGAVPLVQVLGVSATVSLLSAVGEALFSAHAWLKSILWMTATGTALRLGLLLLLIPHYGILGGALAAVVAGLFQEAIYFRMSVHRLKIGAGRLLGSVGRPTVAVSIMAAALVSVGLGWNDWDGPNSELGLRLAIAVGLGATVYIGSIVGMWVALGRPDGGEADALSILGRIMHRVQA